MARKNPPTKPKRTRGRTTKVGRPTKCTPEVIEQVRKAILEAGAGREDAARKAGVSRASFHEWMGRGAQGEAPYADFLEAVEGGERELVSKAEQVLVDLLAPNVSDSVRFATAKLIVERRKPDVWSARGTIRHEGFDGGPVAVDAKVTGSVAVGLFTAEQLANMPPEAIEAALRGLGADDNEEEPG